MRAMFARPVYTRGRAIPGASPVKTRQPALRRTHSPPPKRQQEGEGGGGKDIQASGFRVEASGMGDGGGGGPRYGGRDDGKDFDVARRPLEPRYLLKRRG